MLAQVAEHGEQWDAAAVAGKTLAAMDARWSVPRWLAGRWIKTLGEPRALARAQALLAVPSVDLRVDTGRIDAAAAAQRLVDEHPGCRVASVVGQPQCLRVTGAGDVFYGPLHEAGLVSVQALGSQQAVRALELQPGERVLDACAGFGVKTAQIGECLARRGCIVAVDSNAERVSELEQSAARVGLDAPELGLESRCVDLLTRPQLGEKFDAVLFDAPCTGLGNLARHPELRWTRRYEDIAERATLQRALFDVVIDYVGPAGRLVYSVCSLEPEEGSEQVRRIVDQHDWHLEYESSWTPEEHGADGFYVARLRAP